MSKETPSTGKKKENLRDTVLRILAMLGIGYIYRITYYDDSSTGDNLELYGPVRQNEEIAKLPSDQKKFSFSLIKDAKPIEDFRPEWE